jgi:hypothetical protein
MAQYLDILLNTDENLQDNGSGDFKVGDASNQIMFYIVKSGQGNWKEFPLVGVGIEGYLNSDIGRYELEQIVKSQIRTDVFNKATVNAEDFPSSIVINKTSFNLE